MEHLSNKEINTAEEIISQGLSKAAQSLSFFMKENITLKETEFTMTNVANVELKNESNEELYILSTEIKGELKGICYLVFNSVEKDEICKVALPAEIVNNPEKLKSMQEPLLLEIDNIISASVITQLANQLKLKVYGDVPSLNLMNIEQFKKNVEKQMQPDKLIIGFQTEFNSSKVHFHPEFFWILEPEFLMNVKKIVQEQVS